MIRLEGLSFGYDRAAPPVLADVDLQVQAGEVLAITGPSGRGKSTLFAIMGLLLTPWSGAVVLDGAQLAEAPDAVRARSRGARIGFVFQDALLDPARSVLDNVTEPAVFGGLSRAAAARRARRLLVEVGVDLDPGRRPGQISGGQAQRVALCRALLN